MSEQNGSAKSPAKTAARNMVELAHDTVTLAELQGRLLKIEIQDWTRGLIAPIVLLLGATCLLLGCIPVLLLSVAYLLVEFAGLSQSLSLLLATLFGLLIAGLAAAIGCRKLNQKRKLLERSQEEFMHNINWIKQVLKHHAATNASDARRTSDVQ